MPDKAAVTLTGTVESVEEPRFPGGHEKAGIAVEGADNFYQEIVIENTLTQKSGHEVHLKPGAEVKVTIEAGPGAFRSEVVSPPDKQVPVVEPSQQRPTRLPQEAGS